jgi:AcrR family transcriptional regulator
MTSRIQLGRVKAVAKVDLTRRAEIGRMKRERTRTKIIERALRVVAEKGFDAPTIDDFVDAADVAKGTFYNYFATREAILLAVAAAVADKVDLQLLSVYAGSKDPAWRVAVALRYFVRMSETKPVWGWLIVRMLPIVGGPVSEGMRKGVVADLAAGKRSGRFQFGSMDAAVAYGMGVLLMAVRTALTDRLPKDFGEMMAAMLLQGYGIQHEEACHIAALPLPISLSDGSQTDSEAIKATNSSGARSVVRSGRKASV